LPGWPVLRWKIEKLALSINDAINIGLDELEQSKKVEAKQTYKNLILTNLK
jgi:hypothetical protein